MFRLRPIKYFLWHRCSSKPDLLVKWNPAKLRASPPGFGGKLPLSSLNERVLRFPFVRQTQHESRRPIRPRSPEPMGRMEPTKQLESKQPTGARREKTPPELMGNLKQLAVPGIGGFHKRRRHLLGRRKACGRRNTWGAKCHGGRFWLISSMVLPLDSVKGNRRRAVAAQVYGPRSEGVGGVHLETCPR